MRYVRIRSFFYFCQDLRGLSQGGFHWNFLACRRGLAKTMLSLPPDVKSHPVHILNAMRSSTSLGGKKFSPFLSEQKTCIFFLLKKSIKRNNVHPAPSPCSLRRVADPWPFWRDPRWPEALASKADDLTRERLSERKFEEGQPPQILGWRKKYATWMWTSESCVCVRYKNIVRAYPYLHCFQQFKSRVYL